MHKCYLTLGLLTVIKCLLNQVIELINLILKYHCYMNCYHNLIIIKCQISAHWCISSVVHHPNTIAYNVTWLIQYHGMHSLKGSKFYFDSGINYHAGLYNKIKITWWLQHSDSYKPAWALLTTPIHTIRHSLFCFLLFLWI